jgi:hypothetical protein
MCGCLKQIFDLDKVKFRKWHTTTIVCECRDDVIKLEAMKTELNQV